jgi:bacillolysin
MYSQHGSLRPPSTPALVAALIAVGLVGVMIDRPAAQQVRRFTTLTASGSDLAAALLRVDELLRDGTLDIGVVQEDTMIAGRVHERLNQMYQGLPVFGGQVIRQLAGRSIVSLSGGVYEDIGISTSAALTPDEAADRARRAAGASAIVSKPPVLGIFPRADSTYTLVFRLEIKMAFDIRTYDIHANTGAIESNFSRLETQSPTIGRGTGVLGDPKKVSASTGSDGFRTVDRMRPGTTLTTDFRGSANRLAALFNTGLVFDSDISTDADNVWTDGAVVDSHVYAGWTYDYYFKRFARRGLDDQNIPIVTIVHPLARADAAFYDPETRGTFINNAAYIGDGFIFLGDGDGHNFDYLAGALDVVGHELSHGVTDFTSHLEYRDESGALNEAFSDIMAASIEFFYQPMGTGPERADWIIAEDVTRAFPGYIRSLNNPAAIGNPDHYSLLRYIGTEFDNGGVHFNSTVASHAFYLAIAGGTNRVSGIRVAGVGFDNRERIERIFYRGFAFHLAANARFSDARAATLQAATELFGAASNERAQVAQAWTAVGVN